MIFSVDQQKAEEHQSCHQDPPWIYKGWVCRRKWPHKSCRPVENKPDLHPLPDQFHFLVHYFLFTTVYICLYFFVHASDFLLQKSSLHPRVLLFRFHTQPFVSVKEQHEAPASERGCVSQLAAGMSFSSFRELSSSLYISPQRS